ncbi:MAG: hypothetical protein IT243_07260 [Bacteroidia bacterium]|nr:hypothetical protein [Bacteroidia bacterium]
MSIRFVCDTANVPCLPGSVNYSPLPLYPSFGVPCNNMNYNIQVGNIGYPSTTTIDFPSGLCPCVPLTFEIIGFNFILTGNTYFDDNHTWEHLNIIGNNCCPGGISVTWDPVNCTITLYPTC